MTKEEQFIRMIQDNEPLIFKVSSFYIDHQDDQADLRQEIILQLWRSFDKFDQKATIGTWLYRVAMNTSISFLRKAKRKPTHVPIDGMSVSDEDRQSADEQIVALRTKIQDLSALDRGIVLLLLEERSYAEIAEITGLSQTNVGSKISRIKQKLKVRMTKI